MAKNKQSGLKTITDKSTIINYIDNDTKSKLINLFKKTTETDEFEFIFFSKKGSYLQQEKYIKLLKFISNNTLNNSQFVKPYDMLDIVYNMSDDTVIRCTITSKEHISKIM